MRLPPDVKSDLESRLATPVLSARALADINGDLGEAHVVTDGDTLVIYSRKLGDDLQVIELPFSGISDLELEEDRPFIFLKLGADGTDYSLKFGGLDGESLHKLADLHANAGSAPPKTAPAKPEPEAPAPASDEAPESFTVFCAALYSMMEVDGTVDSEERNQLNRLSGRPEQVTAAIEYLRRVGIDQLLNDLPGQLDRDQSLCLLANLMEIAMVDGYLRGSEQSLLSRYREVLDLSQDDQDALYHMLTIKNDLSIFTF